MIKTFQMRKLLNAEYIQFMDFIVNKVQEKDPETLHVKASFDIFLQKVDELKDLFGLPTSSNLSKEILQVDALRNRILTGLIKIVDGNSYNFPQEAAASGKLLKKNILLFGKNIIRNNKSEKTAKIESLVNDWRNIPELTLAMNALSLQDWIAQLDNANNEFKRLFALRTKEYSQMPTETMKSKRLEVNVAYDDLCRQLNANFVVNNSADCSEVLAGINSYVEQYSLHLKQKWGRAKSLKDKSRQAQVASEEQNDKSGDASTINHQSLISNN